LAARRSSSDGPGQAPRDRRTRARALSAGIVFTGALLFGAGQATTGTAPRAGIRGVRLVDEFVVTKGRIQQQEPGRIVVDEPEVRAVLRSGTSRIAGASFDYLGPTARSAPLASGRLRRQVALKLRAQDGCNVVYVAWRIEPERGIEVTVKRNPGLSRHAQCGARGYSRVIPDHASEPLAIERGTSHSMEAALDGRNLRVHADGVLAWEGRLPVDSLQFDGPAGFRTDNARLRLAFWTDAGGRGSGAARTRTEP
jgi:hypothetical protein